MIGYNRQYKSLDFSDTTQETSIRTNWYGIVLQDEVHTATLRTDTYDRANYHGGYSSESLLSPRVFTFTGKIVGNTKALRHTARNSLVSKIQPEANPWSLGRGFYDLTFLDDWGNARRVSAKVFKMPEPSNDLDSPVIDFTFDLLSENEKIFWETLQTVTWWIWFVGGFTLPVTLPATLTWYAGYMTCTNNGNWASPVKISVVGNVTNPKILNITNWNKYRLTKTTTNLVFDNQNLNNDPTKSLVVTDAGTDIREYRNSGAGIYLNTGANNLVVIADSYTGTPVVTVNFYDSYIY